MTEPVFTNPDLAWDHRKQKWVSRESMIQYHLDEVSKLSRQVEKGLARRNKPGKLRLKISTQFVTEKARETSKQT